MPETPAVVAASPGPELRWICAARWVSALTAILSLAAFTAVGDNLQMRNGVGILFWLGVVLFFVLPPLERIQAEEDRRSLAKFGLGSRPKFMIEWLFVNLAAWIVVSLVVLA